MNWKNLIFHGSLSSLLSSVSCIIYNTIYKQAFYIDFSSVFGIPNMIAASTLACFLMAFVYQFAMKWNNAKFELGLNLVFAVLSFASIVGVFGFNLPLELESPEMFPGLAIPMHFFPIISVISTLPIFKN